MFEELNRFALLALTRCIDQASRDFQQIGSGHASVRKNISTQLAGASPSRICLMAASITHEVLDEPDLRTYRVEQLSMLAERMTACLESDRKAGLLPAAFDTQLVVPVIVTYLQGLWRMALVSYDRTRFERQIDVFLTGLGL